MTSTVTRRALWGAGLSILLSVGGGAAVMFGLPQHFEADAATDASAAPPPAVPVSVARAQSKRITTWEEFSGRLEAIERVEVRPRVGGAILKAHFREGALVKQGDLLVTIDPEPYAAAVERAKAQVEAAEARVSLAKIELERGRKLVTTSAVPQSSVDQRASAYDEAQAEVRSAKAALRTAELDLQYTEVRAPISGRVGRLDVTAGNLVAAGSASPVLTTLVSVDPIYASFNASEEVVTTALARLAASAGGNAIERLPVQVGTAADEGTPILGHIQLINNEVDAATGTIRVRAALENADGRLIPGQFVRIRIGEPDPEEKLVISDRAIGSDQDKKFVFVVGTDNKVEYRQVKLGPNSDGLRIVESGLKSGENIVVNGLQRVRPGVVVAPQQVEETTASIAK
ncbi:efflux RND transporter periplasmic adaptor subunit [Ensifer adhaerens]|jgi:multidrug efflux system membrane fusion protein|uniref:Efflux RND transporter periplasmic adaptor subunit n=1 Tax=Ensifer adhaerens TaxID=106592 RepID=A0A9Q8Y9E0_ENSAD|nr:MULTISPECIES: efflux RND transporter periplasmic adaptor subunit [Ensifer]KSV77690.1 hemolysin secretion protein D [Sinorhizobium sp. GL2]OWZ94957.1 MexE family multidrug efflux RND transporter periplasmic adaptor subunit [Sinorhizobium sp. LM21]ANK71210.1 efflux transporter periplasmic adaptor subunit [Ensifer adhaerens]KDP73883.1 RND transporter MFP subunit [Ensifer adhaerens]KQX23906.1 RND transporter MFP subunit [Ensifer sp. Root423]